jgi:hypothetical protein
VDDVEVFCGGFDNGGGEGRGLENDGGWCGEVGGEVVGESVGIRDKGVE